MADDTGELALDPSQGRLRRHDIEDVADVLRREHARIDQRVTALVDSHWTGPASAAYSEAWREWSEGASSVVDALRVMAQLVGAAMDGIVTADEAAAVTSTDLYARLGSIR